jgi:hypothetical protein
LAWKVADKNTLDAEVLSRLSTRAEVNVWYNASFLGLAIFLVAFGYAFCRYTVFVNGSYPITMVPLYILNKGISWTALWMITISQFAGNLLVLSDAFKHWNQLKLLDKVVSIFDCAAVALPVLLFFQPWVVWAALRAVLAPWNTSPTDMSRTKSMLINMISMKNETA